VSSGTLFLICAVFGALNTANGYRPFSRKGFLSLPALSAGVMTSELPLQILFWQAVGTGLFVWAGALRSTTGVVGLVISVLSWVGLVGLYRAAEQSARVLDEALRGARSPLPAAQDKTLTAGQILFPNRGQRKKYCTTRDLAYGPEGVRNQLDIWRRPDQPLDGRAPVLLQIHGGAWAFGRKENDANPLLTHMSERGWVCVTMNYRLSPKATWPDHIADVKRGIAWVRANIADHGGDPSFVAVTGGSAGGHLSALAALTPNDPAFQPGFEDADTTVQAAVPMYGAYDLTNRTGATRLDTVKFLAQKVFKATIAEDTPRWEAASPICRVRRDAPPFFVVHGTNDSFLAVEQARVFVDELTQSSASPVAFAELPRTQHAFDYFTSVRVHHTVRAIARFLTGVHEARPARTPEQS
jgi:acetyl esterase/lipase